MRDPQSHRRFPTILDVPYGSVEGRSLHFDVLLPNAEFQGPFPTVVFMHGGGWYEGNKRRVLGTGMLDCLPEQGYALVSVEYRLSREARFPAQIDDVRMALDHIDANGDGLGIDRTRVVLAGFSAGAHLAALAAAGTAPGHLRPLGAISIGAPTSFLRNPRATDPAQNPHLAEGIMCAEHQLLGGPVLEHAEEAERANPLRYVDAFTPPYLILHGCLDQTVPVSQAKFLHEALVAVGAESTLVTVTDGNHGLSDARHRGAAFLPGVERLMLAFLDRTLRGATVDLPGGRHAISVDELRLGRQVAISGETDRSVI